RAGQSVLVYGASGSEGVFTVKLAKYLGARATAACGTANVELVRSLGADDVIDYTKQNFAHTGARYDVIYDAVGKAGLPDSMQSLKRGGAYIHVGATGTTLSMLGDVV